MTVTATVASWIDPMGSRTSLQGLANHQAAVATPQKGSSMATLIGTIHGPGLPGPITDAWSSTEPVVSASTSQGEVTQVFMAVEEDDEDIVEIGTAQGFTQLVEPKKEKRDSSSITPCTSSRGCGMGGGASQGGPPQGGGQGCVSLLPIMKDLDHGEGDELLRDLHEDEEEELWFDDLEEGEEEIEDDKEEDEEEEEESNGEVQEVT